MRGGYRPGGGRPRKDPSEKAHKVPRDIKKSARKAKMKPLDYMLGVMNDAAAAPERRDRMAIAAAPFVHPKPEAEKPGARATAEQLAKDVGVGRFATPEPPKLVVSN